MFKILEIIVNLLKKILIITHGGTIFKLIKLLFNISDINGNYKFGPYYLYNLEYGLSTLHLEIYNKK